MITQEKMYDIFYNNQEFVNFVNTIHFKKATPNEKVLKSMLNHKVYAAFLCSINKNLNKKEIEKTLHTFENNFWLKKEPLCLILFLKEVKKKRTQINLVYNFFTKTKLISSIFAYLNMLTNKTAVKPKVIEQIAEIVDENTMQALNLILKHGLVK